MEKSEYSRMYALETHFWWYRVLHELVDATIRQYMIQRADSGGSPIPPGDLTHACAHRSPGKRKGLLQEGSGFGFKILDAGCGTGRMMEILQKYGSVCGIDYSEYAVHYAKERGLDNVVTGDLNDYNFEKENYDVVVCLDVLYHTGIKDDLAVVRKLKDTLKPHGIMILNLPAFEYLRRSHDKVVHTRKRYRRKQFVNQLREAGFLVLKSGYRLPHLYFIILISKMFKGKNSIESSESDLKELPGWLNAVLLFSGRIENFLLRNGITLPVGSSLFVVIQKF